MASTPSRSAAAAATAVVRGQRPARRVRRQPVSFGARRQRPGRPGQSFGARSSSIRTRPWIRLCDQAVGIFARSIGGGGGNGGFAVSAAGSPYLSVAISAGSGGNGGSGGLVCINANASCSTAFDNVGRGSTSRRRATGPTASPRNRSAAAAATADFAVAACGDHQARAARPASRLAAAAVRAGTGRHRASLAQHRQTSPRKGWAIQRHPRDNRSAAAAATAASPWRRPARSAAQRPLASVASAARVIPAER